MDKGSGHPPNPSRLANGQGLGAPQPFTTWGRLPNGQGLGPTSKWTRVGAPQPRFANGHGLGPNPSRLPPNPARLVDGQGLGVQPFTTCEWTRVGGPPTLHDLQTSNFNLFAQALGLPNHRTLEHISQGTGSVSTERNINDKPFVPECTIEQILNFA